MAASRGSGSAEEQVRRSVRRTLANAITLAVCVVLVGGWALLGLYKLDPGQAAVILRFGRYSRTVTEPGLRLHLPPPLESHEIVNIASIESEEFGMRPGEAKEPSGEEALEAAVQTSDNNIVNLGFVVQYKIKDAFASRYRVADPRSTLRDAAQAAMREVVGRTTIDGVLSEKRGEVEAETQEVLQDTLDRYQSGLQVLGVQLQEVQPPGPVRDAFDDVLAALQDKARAVNEAQGYANEVLPKARARAAELAAEADAFRQARVAEATGESQRFSALLAEYRKAPDVTRKRLYIEAMEAVLPHVEKVIVEPGTAVPWLPIGRGEKGALPPLAAPTAPKAEAR
jgi:membrane protease subunit HflK